MRSVPVLGLLIVSCLAARFLAAVDVQVQTSAPLPDSEPFFAAARARLTGNDLMQSRFSYKERFTELNLNLFGRLGTGPVIVAEVYPSPNDALTYRRVIERDGRLLTAAEIADQDRQYRAKYDDWRRQLAREGQTARQARLSKDDEIRAREQAQLADAISLFVFTMEGRSTWEGQPAIIVGFSPKPDARPRTREGRLAKAFSGHAWIHEFAHELLHLNATAIEDVSFGYGMVARLDRGSVVDITRRRVNGTWFPVETRFIGSGRVLIFRRMEFDYHRSYYDYAPFSPDELPARLGWK